MVGTSPVAGSDLACQIETTKDPLRGGRGDMTAEVARSCVLANPCRVDGLCAKQGRRVHGIENALSTLASGSLGEVANPFRQVQYVVLRAQRYSAYDLVDLRLSALNLYAGHETEVEDFEEGDGTYGRESSSWESSVTPEYAEMIADALDDAAEKPKPYWTGPWPALHLPVELVAEQYYVYFEIAVDILASVYVTALSIDFDWEDGVDQSQADAMMDGLLTELLDAWGGWVGILGIEIRLGLALIDTISLVPHPGTVAALAVLYTVWLGLFLVWVWAVLALVSQGTMSPGAAAAGFLVMAATFLSFMVGGLRDQSKAFKAFSDKYETVKNKFWAKVYKWYAIYTIIVILVKVSVFVVCLLLGVSLMVIHVMQYGW
jgi:hypothetical protein